MATLRQVLHLQRAPCKTQTCSVPVGFGFVTPFPDYENDRVWLFGTPADRCKSNGNPMNVTSWWSTDLVNWETAFAFDYGSRTHNVQVRAIFRAISRAIFRVIFSATFCSRRRVL